MLHSKKYFKIIIIFFILLISLGFYYKNRGLEQVATNKLNEVLFEQFDRKEIDNIRSGITGPEKKEYEDYVDFKWTRNNLKREKVYIQIRVFKFSLARINDSLFPRVTMSQGWLQ